MTRKPTPLAMAAPGGPAPVDLFESPESIFDAMKARMPAKDMRTVDGLNRVANTYVRCGRDTVLYKNFTKFLNQYIATRDTPREEAEIFFVTGESGAGKTAALRQLLRNHPLLMPYKTGFGTVSPYVSIKLRGFTHARVAAQQIIRASGYPLRASEQRGDLWDSMASRLRSRYVSLVHIDETQHLIKQKQSQQEREDLVNAIKGVSVSEEWPVAFLLSGLPSLIDLPFGDEQMDRRGNFIHFEDVEMDGERMLVTRILRKMSRTADLELGSLCETDLPDRLAHAANFRYGRITQVVFAAIHEALEEGDTVLNADHFAQAYVRHSMALGLTDKNPFLAVKWRLLEPGTFLIKPKSDEDDD